MSFPRKRESHEIQEIPAYARMTNKGFSMQERKPVIIMGAAGRDFHNFNTFFRNSEKHNVVAFTATQIPKIADRVYPPSLAGSLYPKGIPIYPEKDLSRLIREHRVAQVYFSYSDVSHEYVMQKGSEVLAAGASFTLIAPQKTQVKAHIPVVSVCAVRTGSGKSQTSRKVLTTLKEMGKRVVAIRHPMPYGDLEKQAMQRFALYSDLDKYDCTIEEREEFEPYIDQGLVIYAGIDYERITREAEKEADVLVWDGGNNDTPFLNSDLEIVVVDPLRAGHERTYHPGETNFLTADVIVINKYHEASVEQLDLVMNNIKQFNADAKVIKGDSKIVVDDPEEIRGARVLCIEDGPTVTHGGMGFGAAVVAAGRYGAAEIVDPRTYAVGSIREAYIKYPNLEKVIPALGYYEKQLRDLETSINNTPCDMVLNGSPIDLLRVIKLKKPCLRVRYEIEEIGEPTLRSVIEPVISS